MSCESRLEKERDGTRRKGRERGGLFVSKPKLVHGKGREGLKRQRMERARIKRGLSDYGKTMDRIGNQGLKHT